jgi:hypothetical protein
MKPRCVTCARRPRVTPLHCAKCAAAWKSADTSDCAPRWTAAETGRSHRKRLRATDVIEAWNALRPANKNS